MTVTALPERDHFTAEPRHLPSLDDVQMFHDHYAEAAPTQLLRDMHTGCGYQVKAIADLTTSDVNPDRGRRLSTTAGVTQNRLDMLRLVALGRSYPAIANRLNVGVETVKTQLRLLYAVWGAVNGASAVAAATHAGHLIYSRADDGSLVVGTVLNPQEAAA